MSPKVNPSIFREYDIRGVAGTDLSEDFAEALGLAYSKFIAKNKPVAKRSHLTVSVTEDCRPSSSAYAKALISGLRKGGLDVIYLGVGPTPAAYFSLFHLDLDGGIMITASHLPSDRNGFKICVGHDAIYGEKIQDIRKLMEQSFDKNLDIQSSRQGTLTTVDILPTYLAELTKNLKPMPSKKIVLDCGNGNGSQIAPELFKQLGADCTELYCEMDGRFPNHIPDPSVAGNLVKLIETVKKEKADFGIGIDGDADRVGVVDENGRLLSGDELLIIFSREVLKDNPGATVVSEIKSTSRLYEDIEKNGGKAIMWKAGHSLIKAKMKETHAILGGEVSGHMFFADKYYGYDDALYAAMRIYQIAAFHSGPFSTLLDGLPATVSTPEMRVKCDETRKFKIVEEMIARLQADPRTKGKKFTLIDGVRVDFGNGWGLVRASNTEPVLSIRFEATTSERLKEIKGIFEDALRAEGVDL